MLAPEVPFCFPITRLENSRLILEQFDFSRHAEPFFQGCKDHPDLFAHSSFGPLVTVADFAAFYNTRIAPVDSEICFAILTKPSATNEQFQFAGIISYERADVVNACIEIGHVVILPAFHRTFVTSNAVGLLLQYALDPPPRGLGVRRCQWQSHAANEASRRVAARMGFTFECVQRFQRVVPSHKPGNGIDTSRMPYVMSANVGQSTDVAVFAHYCDEWEEKRTAVLDVMNRQ